MRILIFLLMLFPASASFAQNDTTYTYFDVNKKITQAANALYISKTVKENGKWHKQVFLTGNGHLYMEGYYTDERTHVPEGVINYYRAPGKLTDSCIFKNGSLKAKYTFYINSQIKDYILLTDSSQIAEQGGYTENGQSIADYIVWQPAIYPGGTAGWQKFINRKTKRHQPGGYANGLMEGSVEISFVIDTTGTVTDARIVKKSGYIDLDQRALAIIEKSPKWKPAISNNQPVSSAQKQAFKFANNEVNAQANKTGALAADLLNWIIF